MIFEDFALSRLGTALPGANEACDGQPSVFHCEADSETAKPCFVFFNARLILVAHSMHRAISNASLTGINISIRHVQVSGGHAYTRAIYFDAAGNAVAEQWIIHGAGHNWSGGDPKGSFTNPDGPDASKEVMRFFLSHTYPSV
ncbi:MAG: hypothetical protein ACJ8G3_05210 [Burkholderiaceae bacterium]